MLQMVSSSLQSLINLKLYGLSFMWKAVLFTLRLKEAL